MAAYIFGETLNGACAIESLILFSGDLDPAAVRPLYELSHTLSLTALGLGFRFPAASCLRTHHEDP